MSKVSKCVQILLTFEDIIIAFAFLLFSYPALLIVPAAVEDNSLRRICQCYRHNRFPVVTWRHPRTKALLVRGARSYGKSVIGMLKGHPTSAGNYNFSCCIYFFAWVTLSYFFACTNVIYF